MNTLLPGLTGPSVSNSLVVQISPIQCQNINLLPFWQGRQWNLAAGGHVKTAEGHLYVRPISWMNSKFKNSNCSIQLFMYLTWLHPTGEPKRFSKDANSGKWIIFNELLHAFRDPRHFLCTTQHCKVQPNTALFNFSFCQNTNSYQHTL
ncbi:hypothetical protein AQUCO_07000004v1 [Aquilegia coerulea]|uniref:Uncharacterized protein n=1 Tax=Aquilegia coerulea TaxID=218851 RepID=A0A2G5CAR8_AQUCA|nr:hypothetical protein AQUCO_07000004v1 [Aquilegia coerulea]